jgi:hypothetical protein
MFPQSTFRNIFPLIVADSRSFRRMRLNGAIRRAAATQWGAGRDRSRSEPHALGRPG